MSLADQIGRWMSLRAPQHESLKRLHATAEAVDFKKTTLDAVAQAAVSQAGVEKIEFDTEFPSFCFALATGIGKTRLMGACIYDLWRTRGYRNFFILAPGSTIYDKLRAELQPSHSKYIFNGLADFPQPDVWDGDNYLRFNIGRPLFGSEDRANVFVFNIGKIFSAQEKDEAGRNQFRFHRFNETLGDSFAAILQQMGDLVVLMDESHRYRAPASLKAVHNLKPVLGLEFTATPKFKGNVLFSFGLGEAIGRFVKSPRVVTRTNLTASDQAIIDTLKLKDGIYLHEEKKARLVEFCAANGYPPVKPFVLVSTRDIEHAKKVHEYLESSEFEGGAYQGKVIEIHSKPNTKEESDENIRRLLEVESPASSVEVVVHVTMLKEGWDVTNLYTMVPLRASVSEILTEQTIGRGLRLPLPLTESQVSALNHDDPEILRLSIVSHDKYQEILAAKNARADLFRDPIRDLSQEDSEPLKAVKVPTLFSEETTAVIQGLVKSGEVTSSGELLEAERREKLIEDILNRSRALAASRAAAAAGGVLGVGEETPAPGQAGLFPTAEELMVPIDAEQVTRELRDRIAKEVDALTLQIDVPDIRTYIDPKIGFKPFAPKPSSDFSLVEQHIRSADLKSGEQETGEALTLEEVQEPVKHLAGLLLDEVEEFDATEDKERILQLARDYLAATGKSEDELRKLVHQYGYAMVKDLGAQVQAHIYDDTQVSHKIVAPLRVFQPFSKSIRQKDGEVDLRTLVDRKSDIRRFLFTGIRKSVINKTGFDSDPERRFAIALEDDPEVLKWARPPLGQTPIFFKGETYNIDFIVETKTNHHLIEVKARDELNDPDVKGKARAAMQWCEVANEKQGDKPWLYAVVPDDAVSETSTLAHMLAQAVSVLSTAVKH
ncbi:MAG: DEAD/DEAH box helicase family protein [Acidobacteriia bacterium]|nr:DEAD/DEAH box helicase family protein [Terriglobia bacterium]